MAIRKISVPALPEGYVDCTYRKEQRALIGTWSVRALLSAEPEIGNTWDIDGIMEGGLVTSATKQGTAQDGRILWDVAGYDAGFKLMKSCPLSHELKSSDIPGLIQEIAAYCGIPVDVTVGNRIDIPAKSLVSSQNCAQAILDLALYAGAVAYIDKDGVLNVRPPVACSSFPDGGLSTETVEAKDLDLDGYASGVVVTLGRRGIATEGDDEEDDDEDESGWSGTTPSGQLTEEWESGSAAIPGGVLTWSYRILMPIGAISRYEATIFVPNSGITKTIIAEYEYDARTSVVISNSQEQRLWVWGLTEASIVENSSIEARYYNSNTGAVCSETVKWTATQTMEREYDSGMSHITREVQNVNVESDGAAIQRTNPPVETG